MFNEEKFRTRRRRTVLPPRRRTERERRARRGLDRESDLEISVAEILETAFRGGIRYAARVLEKKGEKQLASDLRRIADKKFSRGPKRGRK